MSKLKNTLQAVATRLNNHMKDAKWKNHKDQIMEDMDVVLAAISALNKDPEAATKISSAPDKPKPADLPANTQDYVKNIGQCYEGAGRISFASGWLSCLKSILEVDTEARRPLADANPRSEAMLGILSSQVAICNKELSKVSYAMSTMLNGGDTSDIASSEEIDAAAKSCQEFTREDVCGIPAVMQHIADTVTAWNKHRNTK